MTKEQKFRRKRSAADFDDREDDFILADLDSMLHEVEPAPVPLNHFLDDEDVIDRLLVNAGFDNPVNNEKDSQTLVVDDISLTDDYKDANEYVIDPEKLAEPDRQVEIEDISDRDIHHVTDSEAFATKGTHLRTGSDNKTAGQETLAGSGNKNDPAVNIEPYENFDSVDAVQKEGRFSDNQTYANLDEKNIVNSDKDISGPEISKLSLDNAAAGVFLVKEGISKPARQQQPFSEVNYPKEDQEPKINKASMIKQKSLKSELDFIKNQPQDTGNNPKNVSTITYLSLGFAVAAFISSIVMGVLLSKIQTKVSKLSDLVSILEEDMSGMAEKDSDLEINSEESYREKLTPKANGSSEHTENQSLSSSDISEQKITAHNHRMSNDNKSVDNPPAKSPFPEQKEPTAKDKTEPAKHKSTQMQNPGGWSINLTAYEDFNYAKSRAAKYIQRKIPVKVVTVDMNNSTWYRLKVDGFKNKEDADAYAAKIKKSLNLSSATVVNK